MDLGRRGVGRLADMRLEYLLQRQVGEEQPLLNLTPLDQELRHLQVILRTVAPILDLLLNVDHVVHLISSSWEGLLA